MSFDVSQYVIPDLLEELCKQALPSHFAKRRKRKTYQKMIKPISELKRKMGIVILCTTPTPYKMHNRACDYNINEFNLKGTHWSFVVKRDHAYGEYEFNLELEPYVKMDVVFRPNSKTSNKSFLLPTEMNTQSEIKLLTRGKFQLGTDITVKNMDTSEIYSCIYLQSPSTEPPYHECLLVNDSVWRVELTSQPRLIRNTIEIKAFLGISVKNDYVEHNFNVKEESKVKNQLVTEYIPVKTGKFQPDPGVDHMQIEYHWNGIHLMPGSRSVMAVLAMDIS
ncbi:Hypothetical predicted protein [Octopus vulgaris]|uniref:Uncharacterized protein n=1 Tax=Octopus vulgaris TaxID=6645 RepID=A0AA36B6E6_OCTVU|nr:Hypothetical predicted protein [Octopus vulgaris]